MESFARRRFEDLAFLDHPLAADTNPPAFDRAVREHATRDLSPEEAARAAESRERLEVAMSAARQLREAGGTLVVGTDAPYPGVLFGEGVHRELELLVKAGYTPLEAISAATHNTAVLMNVEDWGTLEPGKLADIVIVEGRPDRTIGATRAIRHVMQRGRLLDREALELDPSKDPGWSADNPVDDGSSPSGPSARANPRGVPVRVLPGGSRRGSSVSRWKPSALPATARFNKSRSLLSGGLGSFQVRWMLSRNRAEDRCPGSSSISDDKSGDHATVAERYSSAHSREGKHPKRRWSPSTQR